MKKFRNKNSTSNYPYRQAPDPVPSKEGVQGTGDSDSTCLYSAIAKPNMTKKRN